MRLDGQVTVDADWTVIIPVKTLAAAKTRMEPNARGSGDLALAFFLDTLAAVRACDAVSEVLVATTDDQVAAAASAAGCDVIPDEGFPGINAAARHAADQRSGTGGVAVIVSDLPCLTARSLAIVIAAADRHPVSFLADADGEGTTMWFAGQGQATDPRFGVRSRAAHADAGAVDLVAAEGDLAAFAPARRDVDTRIALEQARRLGLGRHTVAVLAAVPSRIVTVADPEAGLVVDESGVTELVPPSHVAAAGLRDLHRGQRLVLRLGPDADIVAVDVP